MNHETATIVNLFPSPVYITKRDSDLDLTEKKDIEDIFTKKGMRTNSSIEATTHSRNTYIFDTKLYNLKEFCEEHIKIYVEKIINPKDEVDFYITQSWLNVVEPGGKIHPHWHSNSIISGVFYISTEEDDQIVFNDPNLMMKGHIEFQVKEYNLWNSPTWFFPSVNNELLLFPSWLNHKVVPNGKATTDRISISFNVFVKGTLGEREDLNQLIL